MLTNATRAIAIAVGQTISFTTIFKLVSESEELNGLISGATVNQAGAAGLRLLGLSPSKLAVLVGIWNQAIRRVMILSTSLVAASLPFTLGMEWLSATKIAAAREAEREALATRESGVKNQHHENNTHEGMDMDELPEVALVEIHAK